MRLGGMWPHAPWANPYISQYVRQYDKGITDNSISSPHGLHSRSCFANVLTGLWHNCWQDHEFSDTLINQFFHKQQPSNFQCNTIPPLAINFAINWSVGYWWRGGGYWKKSTFQLFPSIIKKVLISADLSPATSSPSNFQRNPIWRRAVLLVNNT